MLIWGITTKITTEVQSSTESLIKSDLPKWSRLGLRVLQRKLSQLG